MNWNIVTKEDVRQSRTSVLAAGSPPAAADESKADSYLAKLMKYVPMPIIGAYLIIESLLKQLLKDDALTWGLLVLGIVGLLLTVLFARQVLKVLRTSQLAMSAFAFIVWLFATGGYFATFSFWAAGWGTIGVVIFAILVQIVQVGPLPTGQGSGQAAAAH